MVYFFHGEDQDGSYRAFNEQVLTAKKSGTQIIRLEGKTLDSAQFLAAIAQDDFFQTKKAVALTNLLTRPKSKARDQLISTIIAGQAETSPAVFWWEGKKITPTTLKLLAGAKIDHFAQKDLIWSLLSRFAADNANQEFATLFTQTLEQCQAKYKDGAVIYLGGMFVWQLQQLLDAKQGNYRGAPFQAAGLQRQANQFSLASLQTRHQKLIELDYRAKSGQLKLAHEQELFLLLLDN